MTSCLCSSIQPRGQCWHLESPRKPVGRLAAETPNSDSSYTSHALVTFCVSTVAQSGEVLNDCKEVAGETEQFKANHHPLKTVYEQTFLSYLQNSYHPFFSLNSFCEVPCYIFLA